MPRKSNGHRGGARPGAGRPPGHEAARRYFAVAWLVRFYGWSVRNAALAVALAEGDQFVGSKTVDVRLVRNALAKVEGETELVRGLRRRAKAIQFSYEATLRAHRKRELPNGGVRAEDPTIYGPGPWDESDSHPGPCRYCGKLVERPVLRIHETTMRRQFVGLACPEHRERLLADASRPANWSQLVPEQEPRPERDKRRRRRRPVSIDDEKSGAEKEAALKRYHEMLADESGREGELARSPGDEELEDLDRRIDAFFERRRFSRKP